MTKRDELRLVIQRRAANTILLRSAEMQDRNEAEVIRKNAKQVADAVAWALCEEYAVLEIADIMEWKRTRVRR